MPTISIINIYSESFYQDVKGFTKYQLHKGLITNNRKEPVNHAVCTVAVTAVK